MAKQLKAILGTRKALLIYVLENGTWKLESESFQGVPFSYAFYDDRNATLWACADHGHWGIKLYRSRDEGKNWDEIEAEIQ